MIFVSHPLNTVGLQEASTNLKANDGMLVHTGRAAERSLRIVYPQTPPAPKPNRAYHEVGPISPPPLVS